MSARLRGMLPALALAALVGPGCQTAVGRYFANRGRDFGDCFRLQVGAGLGLGGGVRAAGLVDIGLGGGLLLPQAGVGWRYGDGYAFVRASNPYVPGTPRPTYEGDAFCLLASVRHPYWASDRRRGFKTYGIFVPALASGTQDGSGDLVWLWHDRSPQAPDEVDSRWARLHAFDIEAVAFAGVVGVAAGFSPGEFVDFVLGWFGVDIAGDDEPAPAHLAPGAGG